MAQDPLTEHPDETRARALVSLDRALARLVEVSDADKVMLRDLMLPAWAEWVASMQSARMDEIPATRVQVAAMMLMVNIFWETVVMTTPPVKVMLVGSLMVQELNKLLQEGPGR